MGKIEGKRNLEGSGVKGKRVLKKDFKGTNSTEARNAAQDRDTFWALVNTVLNLRFP